MDAQRRKTKQLAGINNKSDDLEKLRRKREIDARYSRLLLSKSIKHFQKHGHVTICLSDKFNSGNHDVERLNNQKLTTNIKFTETRKRTISFWQFPRTSKCETNSSSRAVRSVRTQTDLTRFNKRLDNQTDERSNEKKALCKASNEFPSSHESSVGNVMSVVIRSHNNNPANDSQCGNNTIINGTGTRTPSRRYNSEHNLIRSKTFWAAYRNFILCNRSIELRITKLFPLQNVQYIVAFSKDFFDQNERHILPPKIPTRELLYVTCFVQFDAHICEMTFVEHVSELEMRMICYERRINCLDCLPSVVMDFHAIY